MADTPTTDTPTKEQAKQGQVDKRAFIRAVAAETGESQVRVTEVINATTRLIKEALMKGVTVNITGFGVFERRYRSARRTVNPQTSEPIETNAHYFPGFRASNPLKRNVKNQQD